MRIIGLDFGSKTVGVAMSDELLITAQGVEIVRRKSPTKRVRHWQGSRRSLRNTVRSGRAWLSQEYEQYGGRALREDAGIQGDAGETDFSSRNIMG